MRRWCLLILLTPCAAASKDLVISGSLERVMHQAITIKRPDGIVVDSRLPDKSKFRAGTLTAKYKFGDQVEITCKPIPAVWDRETHLYRALELEAIRYLRAPSSGEWTFAVASRAWSEPGNLLQPLPAKPKEPASDFSGSSEDRQILERARGVILKYLGNLPNFTADETATRYRRPPLRRNGSCWT